MNSLRFLRPAFLGTTLVFLSIACLWIPSLNASLWLDELQTAWVINGTLQDTFSRAFHTQGFTPLYYVLLWILPIEQTELMLRIPSVILALGSALVLQRIALRFMDRWSAWLSALAFVCVDETIEMAINARPYALAQFGALVSTYLFIQWVHDGKRWCALPYAAAYLLTVYAHFLFGGILLVQALYWCFFRSTLKLPARSLLWGYIYVPLGFIPLIPQVLSMLEKRDLMAIGIMPRWYDLITAPVPWLSAIIFVIAYLGALALAPALSKVKADESPGALPTDAWRVPIFLALWMVLPSTILIASSWILGSSLFVSRYYAWGIPGAALLVGYVASRRALPGFRLVLMFLVAGLSIAAESTKQRMPEDWRAAARYTTEVQGASGTPVLLYSGVIESSNAEWLLDPVKQGQFASPILYYRIHDPWYLLPFSFESGAAQRYWTETIVPKVSGTGRLAALVNDNLSWEGAGGKRRTIVQEIEDSVSQQGFKVSQKRAFGRVWVMLFERQTSNTLSEDAGKA